VRAARFLLAEIASDSLRQRRRVHGLKAERADIVLPGVIVVENVMLLGGYQTLRVCIRGARDGLLLREMERSRKGGAIYLGLSPGFPRPRSPARLATWDTVLSACR
jgi:exopolyphosphatase/pppGpp-phosphohydrolase